MTTNTSSWPMATHTVDVSRTMTHVVQKGWGFDVGVSFERATRDIPVRLDLEEYAKPQCVIAYTEDGKRIHVKLNALREVTPSPAGLSGEPT